MFLQVFRLIFIIIIYIIIIYLFIYLFIYRWQMFYIALGKAKWSQPKIEKSCIYKKRKYNFLYISWLFIKIRELSCGEIK